MIYKMWLEWTKQSVAFFTIIIELSNIYTFTKLVSQHFLNEKTAIDKLLISNCENNLRKQCTIGNFVTIRIWNVLRTVLLSPHWWHTLPRSLWWTILNQKRCPNVRSMYISIFSKCWENIQSGVFPSNQGISTDTIIIAAWANNAKLAWRIVALFANRCRNINNQVIFV